MGLLIEILVVVIAVWVMWRGLREQVRRVRPTVHKSQRAVKKDAATPETLVEDPKTGVYRPVDPPE